MSGNESSRPSVDDLHEADTERALEREQEEIDAAVEAAIDAAAEARAEQEEEFAEQLADDWDDTDEPSADPKIREGYQSALGAFVLEFNRLDNELTQILRLTFGRIGKAGMVERYMQRGFSAKLDELELLQAATTIQNLHYAPIDEIKKIAAVRNFLVHAHFDQNPFDGTYELVPPKSGNKSQQRHLKTEAVRKWTERTSEACHRLGLCMAPYWFGFSEDKKTGVDV